ncbi:MAG: hypothetical protein Q9167_007595 [Letrouitia subvulpina]
MSKKPSTSPSEEIMTSTRVQERKRIPTYVYIRGRRNHELQTLKLDLRTNFELLRANHELIKATLKLRAIHELNGGTSMALADKVKRKIGQRTERFLLERTAMAVSKPIGRQSERNLR